MTNYQEIKIILNFIRLGLCKLRKCRLNCVTLDYITLGMISIFDIYALVKTLVRYERLGLVPSNCSVGALYH